MKIALSRHMAGFVSDAVVRIAPDAELLVIDPEIGIDPARHHQAEIFFLSSDLIEAMKYRDGFVAQCEALVEAAPLRWVQSGSSGRERRIFAMIEARGTTLSSAAGIHSVPMAHYALSHMLAFAKRHVAHREQQARHVWQQIPQDELTGMTVGLLGFGSIAAEIARLAKAFGMRIIALKRGSDVPSDVDRLYGPNELLEFAAEADFLILALPLTDQTRGLVSHACLAAMKSTSLLINIARGAIIDEAALVEALRLNHPAHAVLDVADPEPLDADSPLWDLPNVTITPHDSAWSPRSYHRLGDLFCENLRRHIAGERLHNLVEG